MNKVILMGRLTRDPEVRYSQSANGSTAIARYTLAVPRKFKREGEADCDFINCVAFGKSGEFADMYLHKGMKILVEGHWQTGSYINKDGQKVYTNDCVIESCEFAESKNSSSGNAASDLQTGARPQPSNAIGDGFMNIPDGIDDEGLPFN